MRIASKYCAWCVFLHANLLQRLRGRTVDIVVGAEKEVFSVHEALVGASSSFFDKAMASDWKESQQRTIHLPDDESEIFALYVHWLYYGTLPVFCDEPGLPGNSEYLNLIKTYVLGDKILDCKFQDAAIDAIVEKCLSKAQDGASWFPVGRGDKVCIRQHKRVGSNSRTTRGYVRNLWKKSMAPRLGRAGKCSAAVSVQACFEALRLAKRY